MLLEGSGIYLSWTIEEVVAFTSLQKVSRPAKEDGQILTIRWPDGQNLTIYDGQNMTILTVGAIWWNTKGRFCLSTNKKDGLKELIKCAAGPLCINLQLKG